LSSRKNEIIRYIANGIVATAVHFAVLSFNFHVLNFTSAGLANIVAAFFGITTSFLGSRYFVFCKFGEPIVTQAVKFSGLYGAIAVLHGLVLFIWTDSFGLDFRLGFLIATVLQVALSYSGNKLLVFRT
jgi:putative flippase GtrA